MTEKIEREISIAAPIATVWEVITKPEYIRQWFGSQVEIDVRRGGKGKLIWGEDVEAPWKLSR
ncbi:hypothetical protein KSC_031830 [Ktedonobacter sp. SOSP1-52]|uniref:SRPBCC domain-containing protein n=1 Tax=Ktedonobacter sp. SOSP1-52 TaxID=2778366 RepID=UPI001A297AE3|nr:SRPBCC domain-containing protein [Ktedonobacter sp. SOSP1-52]GHO64291.1 hypothetical protein KSC_031830 [Ktedonobacter sp. SOSP1-52]